MDESTTTDAPVESQAPEGQPAPDTTTDATAVTQKSDESASPSTDDKGESTSNETVEWAKSKGLEINPENPNEVKLAEMQRNAEKKMHNATEDKNALKKSIDTVVDNATAGSQDELAAMQAQVAKLEVESRLNAFYAENPDAKNYDQQMAELVQQNPQLAVAGLDAIYAVALKQDLDTKKDQIKQDGGREALESAAQKQKAAAPTGNATSPVPSATGITREEVARRTQAGDSDWLFKNSKEIDALYTVAP